MECSESTGDSSDSAYRPVQGALATAVTFDEGCHIASSAFTQFKSNFTTDTKGHWFRIARQ